MDSTSNTFISLSDTDLMILLDATDYVINHFLFYDEENDYYLSSEGESIIGTVMRSYKKTYKKVSEILYREKGSKPYTDLDELFKGIFRELKYETGTN